MIVGTTETCDSYLLTITEFYSKAFALADNNKIQVKRKSS